MLCPNGTVLRHPTEVEVAACLEITPAIDPETLYDAAIVGAGPAEPSTLHLAGDRRVRARTVVIASGARYPGIRGCRQPDASDDGGIFGID